MLTLVDYGETAIFIIMLIASIVALAVFIERSIVLNKNSRKSATVFYREFIAKLRQNDIAALRTLIESAAENAYTRFTTFSLEHYTDGHDKLNDLMAGKMIEERIEMEKRLTVLNTLGNNAPFIGLLGTVLGVIKAFHSLGTLGNTGAEVVMRSISRALLATAAGLAIAIPVVMANNYFSKKIKTIMQHLDILSKEFVASYFSMGKKSAAHRQASAAGKTMKKTKRSGGQS